MFDFKEQINKEIIDILEEYKKKASGNTAKEALDIIGDLSIRGNTVRGSLFIFLAQAVGTKITQSELAALAGAIEIAETKMITNSHGKEPPMLFNKCGKAVPNTKAPTNNPIAFPKSFLYQPAAIFIPIG